MQDKPKVSIGVTYYNNEKYIAQCLESLINQTLQEIEIIIVNDCSPDNGIDIINEFAAHDDRIKVISLTENHGVAHAFNVALENATGEYFTECDSDDWVDVRMYEDLYVKAKHNYDLDFITCRSYNVIETSGICRKEKVYFVGYELCNTVLSKNDFMNNEKISVWFNIWVTLFNKDFLNKNNIKKLECASTGTDKSFFILSRVHAQKFMFTENFYYYHRIGNVSSLQHRRSELFGNYKKLFDEMENRLSLLGVLDEYALFFYKFKFIDFVRGVLKKIPVEKTLEAILQMSSVFAHDMEHIIKHKDYEEMLWIMEMKKLIASPKKYHDEYLIERFKISVIVPIYNDEEYLPKSLNSILTQTLKEIDIILVDDGSTDNSLSIIEECAYSDNRVTVVKCKNGGGGAARNAGMQYAKGKYLCFLDADDYFYPNMLEEAYNKAEKQEAEICIWRSKYVRNNKTYSAPKIQFNIDLIPKTDVFCLSDVEIDVFRVFNSSVWNKLFLKSFVDDKKLLFRETHITNDINFVYSALATAKRITTINKALLDYYSGTSDNSLDKYDLYFNEIVDNWKAFKLFLVDNGLFNEKFKNSFLSRTVEIIEYCFSQIKDNNKAKYFDYLVSNGLKAFGLNNASITEMKFDGSAHLNRFLKLKRMLQFSPEQYREYSISLVDAPINYKMIPLLFATSNTMVLALSAAIISAFENANINTFYVVNIMVNKRFDEK
ncbi:MAG: glycosyltransferase, partial [Defluviitaleaceae bacterium]|nr:glycosyltransferase [Defluviitaleaceae bacterium]